MLSTGVRSERLRCTTPAPDAQVTDVHVLKHDDTGNAKGCFVEFETRDDLEKALLKSGTVRRQCARHTAASAQLCPACWTRPSRRACSRGAACDRLCQGGRLVWMSPRSARTDAVRALRDAQSAGAALSASLALLPA